MFCELLLLSTAIFATSQSFTTGNNILSDQQINNITIWGSTAKNATSKGTLQYYLCGNGSHTLSSYTTLSLSSSAVHTITHVAGSFCLLQHLMNIVITSDDISNPAHIICDNIIQPTTGFGFLNTTGLTLHNLHIEHCGGILTHTAVSSINQSRVYFPMGQTAVLLFAVSSRLTLNNISITGMYYGYGIIIGNCYNKVTLNYITISSESKSIKHYCSINEHSWECAGSGLLLLYKLTSAHNIFATKHFIDIHNVLISDNSNHYPLEDSPLDILLSSKDRKVPLFGAGGITNIVIGGEVQIYYDTCIIKHNIGNKAGGMLVIYTPAPTNTDLFMKFNNVSIYTNYLTEDGNGAGLAMYVLLDNDKSASEISRKNILPSQQATSCFICIYNSYINGHHKAVFGGGMYIGLKVMYHYFPSVLLDTVVFFDNDASSGGSALYVEEMLQTSSWKALYMNITMRNVFVNSNGFGVRDPGIYFTDVAVMEFVRINTVHLEGSGDGESVIVYNFGSAIKVSSTNIYLNGSIRFDLNRSLKGGALFLQSQSFLIVGRTANVLFIHNTAYTYGGAIYTTADSSDDGLCPFYFENDETSEVTFTDNIAFKNGGAIYTRFIQNCTKFINKLNFSNSKTFKPHFHLSSPPVRICFCHQFNSSHSNECSLYYSTKYIYPGTRIIIGVSARDYLNQSIYTPIQALIAENSHFNSLGNLKFRDDEEIQNALEKQCSYLQYTLTVISTKSNDSKTRLYLSILGQIPSIFVPIEVSDCPIGFQLRNSSGSCECHPFFTEKKISSDCSINTTSVIISLNTWLGILMKDENTTTLTPLSSYNDSTFGFAPVCPTGYCKPGITEVNMTEQDSLCQHYRTGVLCGGCEDGYSLVLGPDECQICNSNLWLLMVPVFAVAGIVMVIVLFCLRMTISNQLLGGIIFYVNMTEVSLRTAILHQHTYGFLLNIIFSLLNLELGFSVCLYNGLNALIKTALQFIFPVYLWLIVLMLVIISKRSSYVANLTVHSSIQVLATLFYLSFAKLLLTVIDIFIPVNVQTPHREFTVWYVDGNILYFRNSGHVALFITAIITSIFYLLPFLLWTTCGSLLARRSKWIKQRRNLIDAYQGQYRDGWGWWFGARLWLLVCSYISYALLRGNDPGLLLLLHFVFLAPFTFIQVYYKPYRGKWVNIFECVILIDLLLLEFITLYGQLKGDVSITEPYISVLMLLVLLILISLMGWHCMRYMTRYKKVRDILMKKRENIVAKFHREDNHDLLDSRLDDD